MLCYNNDQEMGFVIIPVSLASGPPAAYLIGTGDPVIPYLIGPGG
jgi:hypothetical protein